MKRAFAFLATPLLFLAAVLAAEPAKTARGPVSLAIRRGDSTVAFTIRKWGVIREQGRFRDFSGSDPSAGRTSRPGMRHQARAESQRRS